MHGYPKDFKNKGKRVTAAAQLEENVSKDNHVAEDFGVIHATYLQWGPVQ